MKKILAIVMAVAMVMALSVTAFAAETEIALTTDNLGYYNDATEVDGGLNSSGEQFVVNLPEVVEKGETITIHIKGTSDGDFRVWLVNGANTDSDLWLSTDNGFAGGEFDYTIELTMNDHDGNGDTSSDGINFKGIAYGTNLDNFTLTYLAIVTDGEEVVADTDDAADEAEASDESADTTDSTDTASTETATTTNADTGVVLAVLPMAVAAAAVVASKRR